ncbi:MAG: metallophosphoesterase [Lachnospiraceae bacterium]|nr:metallophosphoesterase [Lachnospiraceae bacterium]MBR6485628.1 metallophosphoesterase [Lachnospiraceae bacterium]
MKVLIVSDTHGYEGNMWKVIYREEPVDMFIHCGDIEHMPTELVKYFDCPVHVVKGNNDYMLRLPEVDRFEIAGRRVVLTHGHHHNIYRNQDAMFYFGEENHADIVIFGHIHMPIIAESRGITILNPGSLSLPRQAGGRPSYIIMTISESNEFDFVVRYI